MCALEVLLSGFLSYLLFEHGWHFEGREGRRGGPPTPSLGRHIMVSGAYTTCPECFPQSTPVR